MWYQQRNNPILTYVHVEMRHPCRQSLTLSQRRRLGCFFVAISHAKDHIKQPQRYDLWHSIIDEGEKWMNIWNESSYLYTGGVEEKKPEEGSWVYIASNPFTWIDIDITMNEWGNISLSYPLHYSIAFFKWLKESDIKQKQPQLLPPHRQKVPWRHHPSSVAYLQYSQKQKQK